MSLEVLINNDMKAAMLAKDKKKLEALRAIKAAILLIKTGKDMSSGEIPEEVEISTLQRLVKQRKEAAAIYQSQGRADLYDEEMYQVEIIAQYLPEQMSDEDVKKYIQTVIADLQASSIKDMGKVMGVVSNNLAGKVDNKLVSEMVKELLS